MTSRPSMETTESLSALITHLTELEAKAEHDMKSMDFAADLEWREELQRHAKTLLALSRWANDAKKAIDQDGPWKECDEFDEECLNCKYCKLVKSFPSL